jgi:hypothetical protein
MWETELERLRINYLSVAFKKGFFRAKQKTEWIEEAVEGTLRKVECGNFRLSVRPFRAIAYPFPEASDKRGCEAPKK